MPEGFVETPTRRRTTRKSVAPTDSSAEEELDFDPVLKVPRDETKVEDIDNKAAANGIPSEAPKAKIIDGWREGSDPKIDAAPHFDFGGTLGVTAMMLGFPALMWYMWVGATYYDGGFPSEPSMTWSQYGRHVANLAYTGAFPHLKAWIIYWTFLVVQGAMYCLMPGVYSTGKPLPFAGGKQLRYYCSGVWSFYATNIAALVLHVTGIFPLYTLIDEFGPLMSVAICSGFIVAIVAYISALARGAQHRMTGSHIYDFFMGAELNPRMFGWLDMKMFFEVRLPWFILYLISLSAAARQWEVYGYVTPEVGFLVMAHFLYANACCKGEEMIVTTWDMYYEKWGFMLIFWNLAGVPLSYCHCTIYLANHDPSVYAWSKPFLVWMYVSYLFAYWVWDTGNSQKCMFRSMQRGYHVHRNTFPQLPWKYVENPEFIKTESGDNLLCDGWYKYARKVQYTADLYFALCWALITGFKSPFPWFYPVFFCLMIVHRAYRDIQRCREKYGEAWKEYERRVPYLFIPVSLMLLSWYRIGDFANALCSTSSKCPLMDGDSRTQDAAQANSCHARTRVASAHAQHSRDQHLARCVNNTIYVLEKEDWSVPVVSGHVKTLANSRFPFCTCT
jgi:delta24(24(1))-sterol reductase